MSEAAPTILVAQSYFDGARHHDQGPYSLFIEGGRILDIVKGDAAADAALGRADFRATPHETCSVPFVMPGLVEAHCHLFLDGGELDFGRRSQYLKAPADEMSVVARRNLADAAAAGITLVRDAGDKYGINHMMRAEAARDGYAGPAVRSPGLALRKPKRYGAFMAQVVRDTEEIREAMKAFVVIADDIKIILTGIIDFEAGAVTEPPQFDAAELALIVEIARDHGRPTFAHCSGIDGIRLAVEAGVDSIEHGFFMDRDALKVMAEKGIAWVPTFSPVHFQWARPELAGWSAEVVGHLRRILDSHSEHLAMAHELGVPVVCGSDAGSVGVPHGRALLDEMKFLLSAGLPMEPVLEAATSRPRRLWRADPADIRIGAMSNMIMLSASPFDDPANLTTSRILGVLGR
ncbi:MAG: amidohydrolase family protein [Alphaproteobacteria bacterium]|nr:amidohydrolase family protein [Alphaproteobacteria bacterium]